MSDGARRNPASECDGVRCAGRPATARVAAPLVRLRATVVTDTDAAWREAGCVQGAERRETWRREGAGRVLGFGGGGGQAATRMREGGLAAGSGGCEGRGGGGGG